MKADQKRSLAAKKQQEESAAARNKIKVSGLPRFYTLSDPLLQSFLKTVKEELKLNVVHTRFSKKGNAWLYLSFLTEEEQIAALEVLKRYSWQGRTLISTLVTTDDLKRKRPNDAATEDDNGSKKPRIEIPLEEQVLMAQIPFYSIDYEEQLSKKHEEAHSLLARVRDLMIRQGPAPKEWCEKRCKELDSDIPFVLDKIRPCPLINEYRNKFDFIVGYKPHLDKYGVGVRVKDADDGTLQIGPIDELRNLPKPMIQLAKVFDGYINNENHKYWLCFTVRKNSFDEYMVIAVATSPNKAAKMKLKGNAPKDDKAKKAEAPEVKEVDESLDPAVVENLKHDVLELFKNIDFCKLVSVYLEVEKGRTKSEFDLFHLHGQEQMKERLHDLTIEISPLTFFRQNSLGTEVLCSVIEELAGLTSETTLLDLFCGSGSLSLTLAKKCKQVIGVEVLESNLKDAKKNAELNGITNCEFIAGKIEDQIDNIMSRLQEKEVVVVLDPPRSGIHAQIVKALRNFSFCKRFVYVCSNHKLPFRNLLDLSAVANDPKPKDRAFTTDPFIPVRIIPVDMTPHSLRSELVIQCDRLPKKDFKNPDTPKTQTAAKTTPASKEPGKKTRNRNNRKRGGKTFSKPNPGQNKKFNAGPQAGKRGNAPSNRGMNTRGMGTRGMGRSGYMNSIRDIERRAYEEGLVKGLEQSAYQIGLAQGMTKSGPTKLMDWEPPTENSSRWSGSNSRNWDGQNSNNDWNGPSRNWNGSNKNWDSNSNSNRGPKPWDSSSPSPWSARDSDSNYRSFETPRSNSKNWDSGSGNFSRDSFGGRNWNSDSPFGNNRNGNFGSSNFNSSGGERFSQNNKSWRSSFGGSSYGDRDGQSFNASNNSPWSSNFAGGNNDSFSSRNSFGRGKF